jgi:tetratricopeptide (TPR) repeat protein
VPYPEWTRALAAVVDGKGIVRGTAFFVGPDAALTCAHVLDAAGHGPIALRTVGTGVEVKVIGCDSDAEIDLALLRVPADAGRKWLRFGFDADLTGLKVISHGFRRDHSVAEYPDGYPMHPAQVAGATTRVWRGQPVFFYVLVDAEAPQGMSGAPAIDAATETVVGILRLATVEGTEVFAVPAQAAAGRWPRLAADPLDGAPTFAELTDAAIPEALAATAWGEFDPTALHCVVVGSEGQADAGESGSLRALVEEMLDHPDVGRLWRAFREAWQNRPLISDGQQRQLASAYSRANVRLAAFDVADVYASPASLDIAVRLIVEADLALFDVTGFEPGVMLLLGVRGAARRGVTVNSYGGGWQPGEPLNRPFNLSDLSLSSHTLAADLVGDDPRIARMIDCVQTGFDQLAHRPNYLDLPVFDQLRQLGSQADAWASIPLSDEVLVLCSYDRRYYDTWLDLRRRLRAALSAKEIRTNVVRFQDLRTPQLVSQSLYERLRRCAGCVTDWTLGSASTFFELGVRLAVSPWSAVQIADEAWLADPVRALGQTNGIAQQLAGMHALFNPLVYHGSIDDRVAVKIVDQLVEMRGRIADSGGHRVRQITADAVRVTQQRIAPIIGQLTSEAEALNSVRRERDNVPQALFYEVQEIKADQERSALERRLAAWLYLEHRMAAGEREDGDELKHMWRSLGVVVADDLLTSADDADLDLALMILDKPVLTGLTDVDEMARAASLNRRKGDVLARRGRATDARIAYGAAIDFVDQALATLIPSSDADPATVTDEVASDVADLLGTRGGIVRRLSNVGVTDAGLQALESYRRGAAFEAAHQLPQTYNRGNAIKLALITGEATVAGLRDDLCGLRDALAARLKTDERAADDAWLWADMGDARLLLGDTPGARSAYEAFAAKARTDSPATTLAMITDIVGSLENHGDPAAEPTKAALAEIAATLEQR